MPNIGLPLLPIEKSPTVAFIALGALSVGCGNSNPSSNKSLSADGSSKTITLKEEELKKITLEDYAVKSEGEPDRKFRLSFGNQKHIAGVMLLRDCDHQFPWANLGEAFGIDSTYEGAAPNAYGFHLLFFHEGLTKIEVSVEIHASRG